MKLNDLISHNRTSIMGIAMMSIMLFHQPFFYGNTFVDFFHLFGHWGVDVFLFVSGFGLVHSLRKNSISNFYKNRCKRLLPACLVVGVFKFLLMQLGFTHHTHDNIILLLTNLYLWYIYAIVVLYIMAPWIYMLIRNYGIWILIMSCLLSFGLNYIPFGNSPHYLVNHISWISSRLPVFVLGMYLTINPLQISNNRIVLIGLPFFIICMGLQLASIMVKYQWNVPYIFIILSPSVPMLCIAFCYIKKIFVKIKIGKITYYLGAYSLEFYLWHEYIYRNILRHQQFNQLNAYIQCTLSIGIIVLCIIITSFLVKRINRIQLNNILLL